MLIPLLKYKVCFSIPDNVVSTVKLFADYMSIFSAVNDANISTNELNKDLEKISEWKMSFHPELEVVFLEN